MPGPQAVRPVGPLVCAALALGSLLLLPACGGPDARKESHLARGQKYLADGKLDKARVEFANALQIAPNDAQARYLYGRIAEKLGDPRTAASMFQAAIDVNPGDVGARTELARLYVFSGRADQALELLKPALASRPDDPELLTVRAAARSALKDDAGARLDAERAVQLAPSSEGALATLAGLYVRQGQPQRAIELLHAALRRTPDSIELHQVLASCYLSVGNDREAEEELLDLVRMRPGELRARLQLAALYLRGKRPDDAERALKDAAAALPESNEAKLAYADFAAAELPSARAEAALGELIRREPRNYDLQLRLGAVQQRAGETQRATETYRSIISHDPEGPKGVSARDRIAAIDVMTRNFAAAQPLLEEVLRLNPSDTDALTLRGNLSLARGDPVAAIADLRAALRGQPGAVPVLRSLARAHLANKSPALAEESLRSALAAAPHDVDVQVDLGELLTRTHRFEEAVTLLEETVKAAPSTVSARTALIDAYLAKGDLAAAGAAAEELKRTQPSLPVGWYIAGLIEERQHRTEDAQRDLERALQAQPSATAVLAELARLEIARGRAAQALAQVRSALERSPGNAEVHELLGELYLGQKSYPEAADALRNAVKLAPNWWLPYRTLAITSLASKDTTGALAAYEAGVKATGEPALVVDLAQLYEQQGRVEDAIRQYEALQQRRPSLEVAANNLAMLLVTYRHDQASLDRARDLTTAFASSQAPALLDTYGWVRLRRGELSEALPALEKAAQEAPASTPILYHLGMAYLRAGQHAKARMSLESALAGGSSFSGAQEARLALAQLKGATG